MKIQELQQKLSEVETDRDYWASKILKIEQDIDLLNDLLATVSVDRDQLHKQLIEMGAKFQQQEIVIALWGATFSKYESWRANGMAPKFWPKSVIDDCRTMLKFSESPSTALTEYMKPVIVALEHTVETINAFESTGINNLGAVRALAQSTLARLNAVGGEKVTSNSGS